MLDTLLSDFKITCQVHTAAVAPDELVHVVGTQEPVRDQPDDRARMLLTVGWLKTETVRLELPETDWADQVSAVQQAARAWLKQAGSDADSNTREQVRWLVEKTRSHESKQQIAQRVWLAIVLYSLDYRDLSFDTEGQIHWKGGVAGRIGLSPDAAIDLAWAHPDHQTFVASFRQPDGTVVRGKGRRRWYVYRLTVDPAANFLFERRAKVVKESVALIVASETVATQPQLPRDFYGGDAFQQACIDAQDQQFTHILVLSPQHGVISLDDMVPSEQPWEDVLERRIWTWQLVTVQKLGAYLFGDPTKQVSNGKDLNWWAWLNPESTYEVTVFGGGFAVRILMDYLMRSKTRLPLSWPHVSYADQRPGYIVGDDMEDEDWPDFDFDDDDDDDDDYDLDFEAAIQDVDQLLDWASELVGLVAIHVPPTSETWELAPDEALVPVRILADANVDIEDFLDLLTDMTLLLEGPIPFSLLINSGMIVSILLQITHSVVHDERDVIPGMLDVFPEDILRQYVEKVLQEPSKEDRLCACLTFAEQAQLIALNITQATSEQLLVWLQTYISARMRYRYLGESGENDRP